MSIMFSQTTRLELLIVAAALLVLLLCRQPPKSGNAGLRSDLDVTFQGSAPTPEDEGPAANDGVIPEPTAPLGEPRPQDPQPALVYPPADTTTPDNSTIELPTPPRPKTKTIGVVDARACRDMNYPEIMYGEVTVRWIWNGHDFVARKVCDVKEKSGAVSTWVFGERDDVLMTEIQQEIP
jgi:hypothetical protein